MIAGITRLNALGPEEAARQLLACCGSRAWARRMARARPFSDGGTFLEEADRVWWSLSESDWREAFRAHPRIGERGLSGSAAEEQRGARGAPAETLEALARVNRNYEETFGHIFIVCASGRTVEEMLALCQERLHNDPQTELRVAAEEQRKITRLRLEKQVLT